MKVLLFGTSGNPPTGRDGHSGIVDYFVNLGESEGDEVLLFQPSSARHDI